MRRRNRRRLATQKNIAIKIFARLCHGFGRSWGWWGVPGEDGGKFAVE